MCCIRPQRSKETPHIHISTVFPVHGWLIGWVGSSISKLLTLISQYIIAEQQRKCLIFAFLLVHYEYLVLPLCLSLSPKLFAKCTEAAVGAGCHVDFEGKAMGQHPLFSHFRRGARHKLPVFKPLTLSLDLPIVADAVLAQLLEPLDLVDLKIVF